MAKLILIALWFIILTACISCDYQDVPEERIYSLNSNENIFEFSTVLEKEFYIKVRGNPTTGYGWYLSENSDKENLLTLNLDEYNSCNDYVVDKHPEGMVGVGGNYYFKFKGLKEGNYNLMFIKKRAWEQNNIAEKRVVLKVLRN